MRPNSSLVKTIQLHPRLLLATLIGLLVGWGLPAPLTLIQRAIFGWNAGVWIYLLLVWTLMASASTQNVRDFAEREDESAGMVLIVVCIAAFASIGAIVVQLGTAKDLVGHARILHYVLTIMTVMGSWFLLATIFTVHYTKVYYTAEPATITLKFPEEKTNPDYWDFLYFSFTIASAAQTSDISVTSTGMRRIVMAQTVLSFLFNAAIIGLSINIAASLIGS